jgi:hypothetical protein
MTHKVTALHVRCTTCDAPAGELCDSTFTALDDDTGEFKRPRMCSVFHRARILTVRGLHEKESKSLRDPWLVPSVEALDESIVRACSDCVPRVLVQLAPLVENDYGSLAPTEDSSFRRLQRRLKKLCEAGSLLQVDLGKRLYAYVSPRSRMARDVDAVRDCIMENFDRSWGLEAAS